MGIRKCWLRCAMAGALLAAVAPPAAGGEAGPGCIVVESVQAHQATCRTMLRNRCAGALSVTVDYEIDLWRFVPQAIPPRPSGEGHEGEPAAGHYVSAGAHTGQQAGTLAAGESRAFDYRADGEDSLIVDCRVRVRSAPAP